jgi:hypothetical protein
MVISHTGSNPVLATTVSWSALMKINDKVSVGRRPLIQPKCGSSSTGRAPLCQGGGCRIVPGLPLHYPLCQVSLG